MKLITFITGLFKSTHHRKGTTRRTKSGAVAQVRDTYVHTHGSAAPKLEEPKKPKKVAKPKGDPKLAVDIQKYKKTRSVTNLMGVTTETLAVDANVMFRTPESGRKSVKGKIVGESKTHWTILPNNQKLTDAQRAAKAAGKPVMREVQIPKNVPKGYGLVSQETFKTARDVLAGAEGKVKQPKRVTVDETQGNRKRRLSADTSLERKAKLEKRLGMTENVMMMIPKMARWSHGQVNKFMQSSGLPHSERHDVYAEYIMGALGSLRHRVTAAPQHDVDDFLEMLLSGEHEYIKSDIWAQMTREGKDAMIRHSKTWHANAKAESGGDVNDLDNPEDSQGASSRSRIAEAVARDAKMDNDDIPPEVLEELVDGYMKRLPMAERVVLTLLYGLKGTDEHRREEAVRFLKAKKVPMSEHVAKTRKLTTWSNEAVSVAKQHGVEMLQHMHDIDFLKEFLKSLPTTAPGPLARAFFRAATFAGKLVKAVTGQVERQRTLCVDFDGVIADYDETNYEPNVFGALKPGAVEVLSELRDQGWRIHVWTCRPATVELRAWLVAHGVPYHEINSGVVEGGSATPNVATADGKYWSPKPFADAYLDDKAIRFTDWESALKEVGGLKKSDSERITLCAPVEAMFPMAARITADFGEALVMDEALIKSWSAEMKQRYPGAKWVTIKEGPLEGRHILILPRKDGTASVLVGGGPAMRHKVLSHKETDDVGAKKDEAKDEGEKQRHFYRERTEDEKRQAEDDAAKKEPKREEQKTELKDQKRKLVEAEGKKKQELAEKVKETTGKDVSEEAQKEQVEQKVAEGADEKEAKKEVKKEAAATMQEAIGQAKKFVLEDAPHEVKANAEDMLRAAYELDAIQNAKSQVNKAINKLVRVEDVLTSSEMKAPKLPNFSVADVHRMVMDESALNDELDAHYKLIKTARGEGDDGELDENGKPKKRVGQADLERAISKGGFESLTGFVGTLTGQEIMSKKVFDAIGSQNAAALARYYLETGGHYDESKLDDFHKYIADHAGRVAIEANKKGDDYLKKAAAVRKAGQGNESLMSVAQANMMGMRYSRRAFEAFGQAEGSLSQAAEMAYAFQSKQNPEVAFTAKTRDSIKTKLRDAGLDASDVLWEKMDDGTAKAVVKPAAYEKMLMEKEAEAHPEFGVGDPPVHSAADIKAGKANEADWLPEGINPYFDAGNGVQRAVKMSDEQQSAARLIQQKKRVYLNFEAGTGKSFTTIAAKAHIDEMRAKEGKEPALSLISMPSKLQANYADEVRKFSGMTPVILDSYAKVAKQAKKGWDRNTMYITSRDMINNASGHFMGAGFDYVVTDEAHKLTQREGRAKSARSEALENLAAKSEHYVAMSGTPTPNDLSEAYFHLQMMAPDRFKSRKEFMAKFGAAHKGAGHKDPLKEFMAEYLDDHVFTAKKKLDTTFDLHHHAVALSPEQKEGYRQIMAETKGEKAAPGMELQRDVRLRELLNSSDHTTNAKFAKAKEIIDDHIATKNPDEKVILYAYEKASIDQIKSFLKTHYPEHDFVEFTGAVNSTKKVDDAKKAFKHNPKVKFAIHSSAGVEGINLQYDGNGGGATTAIALASGAHSYSTLDQFFSRANRTGATKSVNGHLVLTDTPFDIGTSERLQEKKNVADLIQNKSDVQKKKKGLAKSQRAATQLLVRRRGA